MFRWLKDRGRKGRKPSTDSKLSADSVHSKEDDYGFKQKQAGGGGEYKRDLPPTPADLMTSCSVADDDKSFHIYEEIPDLPFRCTPEGELRFTLAKEAASRRGRSPHSAHSLPGSHSSAGPRNISPYMVVPLERLGGTPAEFRAERDASEFRAQPDASEFCSQHDGSFTCALIGRKRPDGYPETCCVTASPAGESGSQGTSSPSCCGSSVFGSPLDLVGRCGCAGGDGGDMSDRLLSAINLTRLLAAVRLSSSSADTCTTSPICIGVDKDGRNISVSVSVTPTTPVNNSNNHHLIHNDDDNNEDQKTADEGDSNTKTCATEPQDHFSSKTETGLAPASQTGLTSSPETGSTSTAKTGFVAKSDTGFVARTQAGLTNSKPDAVMNVQPTQTGLRFLPSPLEQTALSEILQLRPGESTELDPATIDAIILKLCSHTLQVEGQGQGDGRSALSKPCASLQRQELEDVERMLKEMVKAGEGAEDLAQGPGSAKQRHRHHHHQSPAARRAENSDTGFEYDVSTSSESDHANYDYFLSKVARTRSLECEVKKLIRSSDSSRCESEEEEGEEEEEEEEEKVSEAGESLSTASTISPTSQGHRKRGVTPEVDATVDSDDGTMADLSESENSSGYYESAPGKPVEPLTAAAARSKSRGGPRGHPSEKKKALCEAGGDRKDELGDLEVQCYELDCGEADGLFTVAAQSRPAGGAAAHYSSSCLAPTHSQLGETSRTIAAPGCLSGATPCADGSRPPHPKPAGRGRCSGGCKKPHHKHHHHHHHSHPKGSGDLHGGRERKRESGRSARKTRDLGEEDGGSVGASSHVRSSSMCDVRSDPSDASQGQECRRGSADAAAVQALRSSQTRARSDKDKNSSSSKRLKDSPYAKTAHRKAKPTDYRYSLLYHSATTTTASSSSNGASHSRSQPKTTKGSKALVNLERAASFHSEHSPGESVVYESRRQASEVYSIPATLPDPSPTPGGGGGGARAGLKGSASVPSKLSVARQVPESSEVYGTRAGLRRCNNRLLSDLIMLNYNRQVLNM